MTRPKLNFKSIGRIYPAWYYSQFNASNSKYRIWRQVNIIYAIFGKSDGAIDLERNIWKESAGSIAIILIVSLHCALDVGIAIFAIYKLVKYTQKKRTKISVAQVTMLLIILAMLGMPICLTLRHILTEAISGLRVQNFTVDGIQRSF